MVLAAGGDRVGQSSCCRVNRFRYRCGTSSLSVGDGFMIAMAAAPTDATTATSGEVVVVRHRGKSKGPNFKCEGPVAVIRLELDVSDPGIRWRLERQWAAVFRLRRALQRDAAARCRAFGLPVVTAPPIRKRHGSGWGCPAKELRPQRSAILRPAGGCVIT